MIHHSLILDDFLMCPDTARAALIGQEMMDYKASDGVTYPGIIRLPEGMEGEIVNNLNHAFPRTIADDPTMFARFSMETMDPPHWAHSDYNMAEYVGLLFMSPNITKGNGTVLVRHKDSGMELHPQDDSQVELLLNEANNREAWEITYHCPARYNRMFIVNARYLHAALDSFGVDKEDARLVVTVFFHLN